jgi:hypothetical protein
LSKARALQILQGEATDRAYQNVKAKDSYLIARQAKPDEITAVFHKSNETKVVAQEVPSANKNGFLIKKHRDALRTTVLIGDELWEILWE